MKLRPDQLATHLGRPLLPVYVVAGEEPLLIEESLDAIRAAARAQGFSEREVFDVERGFDWGRVIESCGSLSLFATRKIVELRMPKGPGAGRAKAASDDGEDEGDDGDEARARSSIDGAKLLVDLAARPPQDTLLLVSTGKLDYKQQQAAWYLALENAGASIYAAPIPPEQWSAWVRARMLAAGLRPEAEAVTELAERTEGNALAAQQDIAKLALLHSDGSVSSEQVRAAVIDSSRFNAFDLGDRMLGRDAAGAAHALGRLREEGLDVLAVLGPLAWVLRQWAQAQQIFARTGDAARACADARIARARIGAFSRALPHTRVTQIYGWLRQASAIDQLAKSTGGKEQAWEELLTLVLAAAGRRVVRPMGA
ncbi:MAG: DNA polymerase III subunit delta [Panacagrimonas sp.]